jgi:hypothetical protein
MSCTHRMSTLRRVGVAAAAIAIVTGGVASGSAHAATPQRPDVVGSGPVNVLVGNNASLSAAVKNVGVFTVGTTFASITLQRVYQRSVSWPPAFVNAPGASPITGVGTVNPIASGFEAPFSAVANAIPQDGLYRVTVCADTSNFVNEASETNNCVSEIQTVVPVIIGG